ncbi:signal recognition particle protein [Buchnera aphidicola]|uniref:signal recognition particle protein n=1 Tax=Buchnera aphidicola TaxID=9 RepID=UPI003463F6C4
MFNNIKKKFISIIKNISGQGRITEKNIQNTLREIRITLLEADVPLIVINKFIKNVKKFAIGKHVNNSLTPGQEFIKIIKNELISIMGKEKNNIIFSKKKISIFLIIGLQGSGKTTTVGKLGKFLKIKHNKKILVSSADTYRPAAIEQLKILSKKSNIDFFQPKQNSNPIEISKQAVQEAKNKLYDILILDTAGRLHIDNNMMHEIKNIQNIIKPTEILFVLDAMMGQDALHTVKVFNQFISISGIILTKLDSDTRSGSAFSVNYIVKKPIKFIGIGEKINDLKIFEPKKIVSRILGMESVLSIIKKIDKKINRQDIKKINEKITKQYKFNLNDFKLQIIQMSKIGGIKNIIKQLPMKLSNNYQMPKNQEKKFLIKMEAIINSMTPHERNNPNIIKGSRKRRIANGSGTNVQEVNQLLRKFDESNKMMQHIKKKGTRTILQNFKNIIKNIF